MARCRGNDDFDPNWGVGWYPIIVVMAIVVALILQWQNA
jgi:hypothetical protein